MLFLRSNICLLNLEFKVLFPEFEKYKNNRLEHLSGGEQRIIEIYVILVSNTKFVMLDEPTGIIAECFTALLW